ncbi:MAG: hypothetical protein KF760_03150 [Candidatus Eremiobacteraeota bacterium]|nr:hypothetical protein [Candidatus Eremiobacteraeota bacterium]MCW5868680.1 hypothetical protein [Candidatus Eremiobacteraeota bacterium]
MLLYQPIALYWEQGQPEQRAAAEEACRLIAEFQTNSGEPAAPPDLERPCQLPVLPARPADLLEEVQLLLGKGAHSALSARFSELLAYYRQWVERVDSFGRRYPGQKELLAAIQLDLSDYQEAVGALVEQAWVEAAPMVSRVARNLALRQASMENVRRQEGFSPLAELDELAWNLQRGKADGTAALHRLREAQLQVGQLLEQEFPDPRLRTEWIDLWAPLGRELAQRLATPDLSLLARLEDFFRRHAHWLQRARQRRDFSRLPWWRQLREKLVGWFAGQTLRESVEFQAARCWLHRDFSEWPEADRELRLHYSRQTSHWLDQVEACLAGSARQQVAELLAFGDLHYDRWLWLESGLGHLRALTNTK